MIVFENKRYEYQQDETVLDALVRQGAEIPFSCRGGSCRACVLKCVDGDIPEIAKSSLRSSHQEQNLFMPCLAKIESPIKIVRHLDHSQFAVRLRLLAKDWITDSVLCLKFKALNQVEFKAGQYFHFVHPTTNIIRSYSVASLPTENELEIHVRKMAGGAMFSYLESMLMINDEIVAKGPHGDCYYDLENTEKPLLLICTGTGLAPMIGVAKQAIEFGHNAPITIVHGSYNPDHHYLPEGLTRLLEQSSLVKYIVCHDEGATGDVRSGRVLDIVKQEMPDLSGYRVYIAGNPQMVESCKRQVFLAGVSHKDIFADAFIVSNS